MKTCHPDSSIEFSQLPDTPLALTPLAQPLAYQYPVHKISAKLQPDTTIKPNTHVTGSTTIGRGSVIGPNSMIHNSQIGIHCTVLASIIEESTLEDQVSVGPYSHVRAGTYLETDVNIGNYVEIKASRLGLSLIHI